MTTEQRERMWSLLVVAAIFIFLMVMVNDLTSKPETDTVAAAKPKPEQPDDTWLERTETWFGHFGHSEEYYLRGKGFTKEATDLAVKAASHASHADGAIGSTFDVVKRMERLATTGSHLDDQALRSIGTDLQTMNHVYGLDADVYTVEDLVNEMFKREKADSRLESMSNAMERKSSDEPGTAADAR